jgi:type II secretory pathway pseudopilin PulG
MDVSASAPLSATTPNSATSSGSQAKLEKTSAQESTQQSQQEQQQIQELKARDRVVRAHEAAHIAAGAGIVKGGATFSFQRGPDGVQYAIGGEVQIDTSKVAGDPQATAQKAEKIRAAALAPAQPSSTDQAVASRASQMAIEARAEISQQRNAELDKSAENNDDTSSNTSNFFTSPEPTGNLLNFTV